jgi:hypothetical protein
MNNRSSTVGLLIGSLTGAGDILLLRTLLVSDDIDFIRETLIQLSCVLTESVVEIGSATREEISNLKYAVEESDKNFGYLRSPPTSELVKSLV